MNIKHHTFLKFFSLLIAVLLISGCSAFQSDKERKASDSVKPSKLVDISDAVNLRSVWSTDVGNGQGDKYNRLTPAINSEVIYAAANNGEVVALNRLDGTRIWREKLNHVVITGGVGYGDGLVLLGTEDSTVIALDATNGQMLWETEVSSEVLSRPAASDGIVVVQTIDDKLQALSVEDGSPLWIYESAVPALTLRGTSSPLIIGNFVYAGFGNGTIASVALDNGTLRWDERISVPTGRTEIDRLVDVDAELFAPDRNVLLVPGYNGYLVALNQTTGQLVWRVPESSTTGVSSGFGNIYITTQEDRIVAYQVGQVNTVWTNDDLYNRQLSSPVTFNNYVVAGDVQGYVHLVSQVDGSMAGRLRVDKKGVRAPLISRDGLLYIYGNGGELRAYELR